MLWFAGKDPKRDERIMPQTRDRRSWDRMVLYWTGYPCSSTRRQRASFSPIFPSRPNHIHAITVYRTSPCVLVPQTCPYTLQVRLSGYLHPTSFSCLRRQVEKPEREESALEYSRHRRRRG